MNKMTKIRTVGFVVIATLGLIIFLSSGRNNNVYTSQINWEETARSINNRNNINNNNASGAPQQTVVNGWTTINWLELISEQIYDISYHDSSQPNADNRIPTLLLLFLLGACLNWITKDLQLGERKTGIENTMGDIESS